MTARERVELVELRRRVRVAEMQNGILRRPAAHFPRETLERIVQRPAAFVRRS